MATKQAQKTEAENIDDVLAQAQEAAHQRVTAKDTAEGANNGVAPPESPTEASSEAYDPSGHYVQISGRNYLPVAARIAWLNSEHDTFTIATFPLEIGQDKALFRCDLTVGGKTISAHGSETVKDFGDFIEKAETKAVGRALAYAGYGTPDDETAGNQGPRVVDSPRGGTAAVASPTSPQGQRAPVCSLGVTMVLRNRRDGTGQFWSCGHKPDGVNWHGEIVNVEDWNAQLGVDTSTGEVKTTDDLPIRSIFDTLKSIGGNSQTLRQVMGDTFTPQTALDGEAASQQDWAVQIRAWGEATKKTNSALMGLLTKAVQDGQKNLAARLAEPVAEGGHLVQAAKEMGAVPASEADILDLPDESFE